MRRRLTVTVGLALLFSAGATSAWARTVYERDSMYSHIRVEDSRGTRTLYFNASCESTMSLADPLAGALEYTNMFHAAFAFKPDIKRVLVLGLGGASTPKAFLARYPEVTIDVVEIDPVVIDVAKSYFYLPDSPKLHIIRSDARQYLAHSRATYDAIFVDAYLADYYGNYVPFHLATQEFFKLAEARLNAGGVIGYNVVWGSLNWNDRSVRAIYKTMASVFGQPYLFPVRSSRNMVLMCVSGSKKPSLDELAATAREFDKARRQLPVSISSLIARAQLAHLNTRTVPLLTDDYAPVEALGVFR